MTLVKTSLLSGLSTGVKVITGLFSLKIIAIYLGPEGVAQLAQFTALINILSVVAGGGITLGVIKYVSEFSKNAEQTLNDFLSTSFLYTLFFCLLTAILAFTFHRTLSIWILGSASYSHLIILTGISQVFMAMNLLLLAILNGLKQIARMTVINILGSLLNVILMISLTGIYGVKGALLALIISQGLIVFISIFFVFKQSWLRFLFDMRLKGFHVRNLSSYSLMNIISILTVPISQIVIRNDLSHLFSWKDVGYWQAVIRVGDAYLLLVSLALTAYYLPRLAELEEYSAVKLEVYNACKIILPVVFVSLFMIYFARNYILLILYNADFLHASNLFMYHLIGDFFRIAGWLLTYILIAKSWAKTYISTEIALSILFVVCSHYMVRSFGLVGVTYSFALTYLIYWLMMSCVTISFFKKTQAPKLLLDTPIND